MRGLGRQNVIVSVKHISDDDESAIRRLQYATNNAAPRSLSAEVTSYCIIITIAQEAIIFTATDLPDDNFPSRKLKTIMRILGRVIFHIYIGIGDGDVWVMNVDNLLEEICYVTSAASRPTDTDRVRFKARRHNVHCVPFLSVTSCLLCVVVHAKAGNFDRIYHRSSGLFTSY